MISLTDQPFEPGALLTAFSQGRAETGAIATFTGLARAEQGATRILELEAYPGFTEAAIGQIATEAAARFALNDFHIVHRIGDLSVAAIPCEVFVEIGLELKKTTPFQQHFTISLANGYNGYLPTPEHHRMGGYETWRARSSYLEVDASTKILKTLNELIQQVAKP